jgi:hypothetical protein
MQPHAVCRDRTLQYGGAFDGGDLIPRGKTEDFLVAGLKRCKGYRNGIDQISGFMWLALPSETDVMLLQRIAETEGLCLAAAQVCDLVERNPVEPWRRGYRDIVDSAPGHQKGLGHDFLSQILSDAPAGKIANQRMLFRVQRREALRVIGVLTRGSHREVRVVVG